MDMHKNTMDVYRQVNRRRARGAGFAGLFTLFIAYSAAALAQSAHDVVDEGNGVLKQISSGLEWTQSDNGLDIDWVGSQSLCANMSGGWRLPTVNELLSLYNESDAVTIPCGSSTCKVSSLFRLSSFWFWSSERDGTSDAWAAVLDHGKRVGTPSPVTVSNSRRALCVRRPQETQQNSSSLKDASGSAKQAQSGAQGKYGVCTDSRWESTKSACLKSDRPDKSESVCTTFANSMCANEKIQSEMREYDKAHRGLAGQSKTSSNASSGSASSNGTSSSSTESQNSARCPDYSDIPSVIVTCNCEGGKISNHTKDNDSEHVSCHFSDASRNWGCTQFFEDGRLQCAAY